MIKIYKIVQKNKNTEINTKIFINSDKSQTSDERIIANNFAKQFNYVTNSESSYNYIECNTESPKLSKVDISLTDVLRVLGNIDIKKANHSLIPSKILKLCSISFAKPLYYLFNKIIQLEEIPKELKISKIIPILKPNKPKNIYSSYRPIALQNNIFKLFEKLLMKNFLPFIYLNNLIPETQYLYKKFVNYESQLIDMLKITTDAFNDKNVISVIIIFLDFSNVFNSLSHDKLFTKLSKIGITDEFIKILINSFKDRQEFVSYNNFNSEYYIIKNGIPQGGISSPILFNIYKSDIGNCIKNSGLFEFSDDSLLLKIIRNTNDCRELQYDLDNLYEWCVENELNLNPNKTELINIHTKTQSINYTFRINNIDIQV